MDSTGLRAVQQPLKDAYREDPQQAVVTLRAHGELGDEGISCSVDTGRATAAVAGLHPIVDLNFIDFAFGAMDEIANQAAKIASAFSFSQMRSILSCSARRARSRIS